MQKIRNYLTIAGIINFIIGILCISVLVYSIALFAMGAFILYLSRQSEEYITKEKNTIFILGLISIPLNLLAGVFLIISSDQLSQYEKTNKSPNPPPKIVKKIIDPEMKKIDSLLKLGVFMVFISAILFTTTSWNFFSSSHKIIGLILFGFIFLGLAFITEKKLKLYHSAYIYWFLGMTFFALTIVGTIYFGVMGLTYDGSLKYLAYFITFITVAGLSLATYLKFSKAYLLYITYTSFLLSIIYLLLANIRETMIIIIIISILLLIINIFSSKESILANFSKIVSYLITVFIVKNMNQNLILVAACINIVNLTYLAIKYEFEEESLINLVLIYTLVGSSLSNLNNIEAEIRYFIMFVITSIYTFFMGSIFKEKAKTYNNINYALYSLFSVVIFLLTYDSSSYEVISISNRIINFMVALVYLVGNILFVFNLKRRNIVAYCQPLAIFLLIASILNGNSFSLILSIATIIYCLLHNFYEDKSLKNIYLYSIAIGIIIVLITNKSALPAIITLLASIYLFYKYLISAKEDENNKNLVAAYILAIANVYKIIVVIDILKVNGIISSIIMIWLLLIITILNNKDNLKKTSLFIEIIPMYNLINELKFSALYKQLMISIMILYCTFLIVKYICKNPDNKNIIGIVGIVISILEVLFLSSYVVGIYIGIIGIITIIIGYYQKELKYFFSAGILITILNIIYQLKIWTKIPFWLYLLIGGLSIIGFVTYKEMKKTKNKE